MTTLTNRPGQSDSDALSSIFALTRAVANAGRNEDIYEAALLCLKESLGVQKSSVLIIDPDGVMRFKAWFGLSAEYRKAVEGHSPWERDARDPEPILVPDVRSEASLAELQPVIEQEGIQALAFIPLALGGRLIGKFMLYYPEPREFSADEVILARTIATQVAFALDQQAHRRERGHLEAVFRSAITGVTQLDANARFQMVNDHFCTITGWPREELLKLDSYSISHPDDREPTRACLQALANGAPHFVLEKRYVRPDGSVVWVQNNFSALRDGMGKFAGAIGIVLDISERKASETILRESEERFRNLISALGLAVYTTDAQGRITLYNEAARELWGRAPEIGADRWCGSWRIWNLDGVTEMSLDDCPMAVSVREQREVRGVEIIVERPDGTRAHVLPHPTPLRDSSGRITGAVNVLVDITELRRAEEAVRKSEERFRSLTSAAPVGIFVGDEEGNCLMVNQQWLEYAGLAGQDAALGRGWLDTLHPEDRQRVLSDWTTSTASGSAYTGEYRFLRRNGTIVWVKGAATALPAARAGESTVYICTMTDITALKQAEQLKDQFLGLVSHELRTPLATIYGSSRLLRDRFERIPEPDRAELLSDVVSETERLQRIIENLLLLTRLDATGVELEPVSVPIAARRAVEKYRARHPYRQIAVSIDNDVPAAMANLTYVELVLENLIGNALKYSPADAPVEVAVLASPEGPAVQVRDRGIGIAGADLPHLFEPFYRSARARGLASGVGIGLSVCKRVIEVQGGRIWGVPREDGGSEFGFVLEGAPEDS